MNIDKLNAIKNSVVDTCNNYGLSDTTTARIAKNAGVSPATIYLHYENKTDLLSHVYEEVKTKIQSGLDKVIDSKDDLEIQIKKTIEFSIERYIKYPKEFNFVNILWNNPEQLNQHAIDFEKHLNDSLLDLFKRIDESSKYVNVSNDILEMFFALPLMIIQKNGKISDDSKNMVIKMTINALKK